MPASQLVPYLLKASKQDGVHRIGSNACPLVSYLPEASVQRDCLDAVVAQRLRDFVTLALALDEDDRETHRGARALCDGGLLGQHGAQQLQLAHVVAGALERLADVGGWGADGADLSRDTPTGSSKWGSGRERKRQKQ